MITHSYPRKNGTLLGWFLENNLNMFSSASTIVCHRTRTHKLSRVDKITPGVYLCQTEDTQSFLALVTHDLKLE
jgi:hypothetical protein